MTPRKDRMMNLFNNSTSFIFISSFQIVCDANTHSFVFIDMLSKKPKVKGKKQSHMSHMHSHLSHGIKKSKIGDYYDSFVENKRRIHD